MRELHMQTVEHGLLAQLQACRDVTAQQAYDIRQLQTIVRMLEIELAEKENELAHWKKKAARMEATAQGFMSLIENAEVLCG